MLPNVLGTELPLQSCDYSIDRSNDHLIKEKTSASKNVIVVWCGGGEIEGSVWEWGRVGV